MKYVKIDDKIVSTDGIFSVSIEHTNHAGHIVQKGEWHHVNINLMYITGVLVQFHIGHSELNIDLNYFMRKARLKQKEMLDVMNLEKYVKIDDVLIDKTEVASVEILETQESRPAYNRYDQYSLLDVVVKHNLGGAVKFRIGDILKTYNKNYSEEYIKCYKQAVAKLEEVVKKLEITFYE